MSSKKKSRNGSYKRVMSRRTLLRGAGTVAIGLPFLSAMQDKSAYAALPEPPARAFNVFFGLGFPTPLQSEGYDGPMEPLAPLRDKLAIVRGVDQYRADRSGDNAHYDGAGSSFAATAPVSQRQPGGATLDQLLRRHAYPDGLPDGITPAIVMGTYFRRIDRPYRYIHSWNPDGSAVDLMIDSPQALFDRIFGGAMPPPMVDEGAQRQQRIRRSVLDGVLAQYRHLTGDGGNLGRGSRQRVRDHLARIREYERRAFPDDMPEPEPGCVFPDRPGGIAGVPHGDAADPGGEGIDIGLTEMVAHWRLMADLYALAVQCDMLRFGAVTYMSSGERIRLTGRYEYEGRLIYDFNDRRDRGTGGAQGCSHEFWHAFNESRDNTQLRAHLHLKMREVAYFLTALDQDEHRDANGNTILENAMITVSTESGDGRHNDVRRELSGIFHAISSGNDRFAVGDIHDVGAEGIDVYNTMLSAYGVPMKLGPGGRTLEEVTRILR